MLAILVRMSGAMTVQLASVLSDDVGAVKVYFPILLCVVVSVVLTIVLNIFLRLR